MLSGFSLLCRRYARWPRSCKVSKGRPIPLFRSLNDDRGRGVISPVPTFFRQLQLFPSESLKIFAKLRPEKKRTARNQLLEITSPYLLPGYRPTHGLKLKHGSDRFRRFNPLCPTGCFPDVAPTIKGPSVAPSSRELIPKNVVAARQSLPDWWPRWRPPVDWYHCRGREFLGRFYAAARVHHRLPA